MGAGGGSVTIRDERTVDRVLKRLVAYRGELVCLWGVFGFVTSHVLEKLAGVFVACWHGLWTCGARPRPLQGNGWATLLAPFYMNHWGKGF